MRHAVVLAGGSGKRLWPMSTRDEPKQLVPFPGGGTLLGMAVARVAPLVDRRRLWVCAAERHRERITAALDGLEGPNYLGEPVGRDTYLAIALTAAVAAAGDPGAVLGVFTSDQVITPVERFRELVRRGFELVESGAAKIVTFGIVPTHPATSYGYLELGTPRPDGAVGVKRFREKPDRETAVRMVEAGPAAYLWNSGMFVFGASALLERIGRTDPALERSLTAVALERGSGRFGAALAELYAATRSVSFDYAVMEQASADPDTGLVALPMRLDWVDVGSWPAYASVLTPDTEGNAAVGRATLHRSRGCAVVSRDPDHLVALLGCEDLVVIHTPKSTLVMPKTRAEELKELVEAVSRDHTDAWL